MDHLHKAARELLCPNAHMKTTTSSTFWEQVDAILVINLAHRTDRWEKLYTKLAGIGVADKVHRIDAIYGRSLPGYLERPWFSRRTPEAVARMKAGSAGCCLSHRKAIEFARDRGFRHILLLEDDALFNNDLTGREGELIAEVLADDQLWDMFYLGFYQRLNKHHVAHEETIDGHTFKLMRIRGPLMFHATMINQRIYDRLLDELPSTDNIWSWMTYWGSIDAWIQNRFGRDRTIRIWGTQPRLVVQEANYSDICEYVLSVEESEGTHFKSIMIPLGADAFERCLDLSTLEKAHQVLKRGNRWLRARLLGHKKT